MNKVRKLKAVERNGKIFALCCILMSLSYTRFLHDNPKAGEDPDTDFATLKKQVMTLEKLLCFHDWLFAKQHENATVDPDLDGHDSLATTKIRKLMDDVKFYFPQHQGMGWKLTKFHQLLHFPCNIWKHGSTLNFDGGCPEYYGKVFHKDHATRTQRQQINLSKQTAQRYFEKSVVVEAESVLAHTKGLTYGNADQYKYIAQDEEEYRWTLKAVHDLQIDCHVLQSKLC
jgi:hypothetical protein